MMLKVIFALGLFQGLVAIVILLSCRCFSGFPLGAKLMKNPAYRKFFKYHCYLWWPFFASVVVHMILAIRWAGFPF